MAYQLFFDRFLNKVESKNDNESIYGLNFEGMLKAFNLGIKIEDIYVYFLRNCSKKEGLPTNVEQKLFEWLKESEEIK